MPALSDKKDAKTQDASQGGGGAAPQQAGQTSGGANAQQQYNQQLAKQGQGGAEAGTDGQTTAGNDPNARTEGGEGGDGGQKSGLANYEATLGTFLGAKLYTAVSDSVKFDKVQGYAHGALKSAIDALVGQVANLSGPEFDAKAQQVFGQALDQVLGPYVDQFMAGPGKDLTKELEDWVDASPRAVAVLAILAAVGMVASNQLIPTLKAKYKVTPNIEASVEAKLGRFQQISLEQIKAQIEASGEFSNAQVKARLEFVHDKQKGDTYHGEIRFQDPTGKWVVGVGATKDQTGESVDGFLQRNWPENNLAIELRGRMHDQLGSEIMLGVKWKF